MTTNEEAQRHLLEAEQRGDSIAVTSTPMATVILITKTPTAPGPEAYVPLRDAARIAATKLGTLRTAIRTGALLAFGNSQDRSIRRADLDRWIESRAVIHGAVDDDDIERRVRRIAKEREHGT